MYTGTVHIYTAKYRQPPPSSHPFQGGRKYLERERVVCVVGDSGTCVLVPQGGYRRVDPAAAPSLLDIVNTHTETQVQ
jgi:hypothetical protein